MKHLPQLFCIILVPSVFGVVPGDKEEVLMGQLGKPLGFIVVGNKKMLKYYDQTVILENNQVVQTRKISEQKLNDCLDIIILDAAEVLESEPLGFVADRDAFVRGGRFNNLAQERLSVPFISVSGLNRYLLPQMPELEIQNALEAIRKIYLRFDIGWGDYDRAVLLLHTAKAWNFDSARNSPPINVYAIKTVRESVNRRQLAWSESNLTWANAMGNSRSHGADLTTTVRLTTRCFPATSVTGINANQELRFDLGDLSELMQVDGSVTLMVTQSSPIRLDFISKDSDKPAKLKPRILLK